MTNYGYRLWALDLHVGMKRERHLFDAAQVPIPDADGNPTKATRELDYSTAAVASINTKLGRTHNFGMTQGDEEGAGGAAGTGTSLRFTSAERVGNALRLNMAYGLRHSDGTVIDPADEDADDVDLRGKSILHPYRATLVTQPGSYRALLAVETRGRACPMVSLVRGLRAVSDEGLRVRAVSHVAGRAAMLDFIANSEIKRVNFEQWAFNTDGAKTRRNVALGVVSLIEGRGIRDFVGGWCAAFFDDIQANVIDEDVEAANEPDLAEMTVDQRREYRRLRTEERKAEKARRRAERRVFGRRINRREAGSVKTALFADRDEDVTIDFTDVSVEMLNGVKRVFGPLSDYQKLTYSLGTTLPSDSRFFQVAEETVFSLLEGVQELPAS